MANKTNNNSGLGLTLSNPQSSMGGGLWGSIISGITNLIGLPIQNYYNNKILEKEQEYAQKNAEQEQAWTQENMKLQGDINNQLAIEAHNRNMDMYEKTQSTQAKVRELEQAGLSVGMMQGTPSQGGASAGGTAQVSGATGARVATPKMNGLDIVGAMSGVGKTIAEIKKMQEETRIMETQHKILEMQRKEAIHKEMMTRLERFMKEREFNDQTTEYIIRHSHWTDENGPTSLTQMALNNDTFDDFLKSIKIEEGDPDKGAFEGQKGVEILHNIYNDARRIGNNILGMNFNAKNWNFQQDIIKAMENEDFANMNAKAQAGYLRANIATTELTTTQKEAWNNVLDKIENENIKNGLIVLAMIVNQMAGSWHMPNMSTYNTNNYVTNQ